MAWNFYTNYLVGYNFTWLNATSYANNFSWSYDKDTVGVSLNFDSFLDFAEGRSHVVLKKDDVVVFSGVVIDKKQNKTKSTYTAQDYSYYLNRDAIKPYQFNGVNAKVALETIFNDVNMPHAILTLTTKINKFYWGKTYIDIIKDILDQCKSEIGEDVSAEIRDKVIWIDKVSNLKIDNCKFIIGDDYSVDRSMDSMTNYVIVSNNSESTSNSANILATVKDDNNVDIFGRLSKILSVSGQNEAQARNAAQNYLNNFNSTKKGFTVTLADIQGCENIRANRKLNIVFPKYGVNGTYKITNAQHTLNNGIHKVAVTVDFSGVSFIDTTDYGTKTTDTGNSTTTNNNTSSGGSKADQVVAYAKQFLGVPYVWGGKDPSGFDCSGFVAYVFAHFGINLTAYTYDMVNEGTKIPINEATVGDILFFYNTGHVAIYIGNDEIIQAPHTGDVVKISQFSGHYEDNCNAAIRVL